MLAADGLSPGIVSYGDRMFGTFPSGTFKYSMLVRQVDGLPYLHVTEYLEADGIDG